MSTHTPAPWIAEWSDLTAEVAGKRARMLLAVYATPPDRPEATYVLLTHQWAVNAIGMACADADINLICAAPYLLDALKQLMKTCPADIDTTTRFNAAWNNAVAAIAKAEGGAA